MNGRLSARCYIVTGAGSGIGRATAHRLGQEGATIVLVGRRTEPLAACVMELDRGGARAITVAGDVAQEATAERAVAAAQSAAGRLDGFVHAAGAALRSRSLGETTAAEWDSTFDVHVRALRHLVRHALPALAERGGALVAIASNLALLGIEGLAAYSAAKGAVTSLARALAVELGPRRIRVNAVLPGLIETPATRGADGFAANAAGYAARAPLRRIGQADEIAAAVAFLLSDDASFITGHALVADGGASIA
ncbi:MAG: SDR family oxidoreductase [Planctomycetes bacterium]|nr:SDR family oxidoreductase [Planctomycetota bacterium]